MNGLVSENDWKGLTLKEAINKASLNGFSHRIVEENGRQLLVDPAPKNMRVNFRLRDGVVISVFPG
jgi:hypothetical protein